MGVANSYAISAGAMGSAWTGSAYARDDLGRVLGYVEYKPEGGSAYGTSSTYNSRNELVSQTVTITGESSSQTSTTTYDYRAETTPGVYTGAYMGGAVVHSRTTASVNGTAQPTSDTKNVYEWWDGARIQSTVYDPNIAQGGVNNNSSYYYDDAGHLASVHIQDGNPRTVSFITNAEGLVLRRQERDGVSYTANPLDLHYYFDGVRIGDVGNEGAVRADFDQNADDPGGRGHDPAPGRYTVEAGDTLASVAQSLWGDANLWWRLAEANGLSGAETLIAGQSLTVPQGVVRTGNHAATFRPYDPGKTQGDLAPLVPRPQAAAPRGGDCGAFGAILLVVVAVAVTAILAPPLVGNAATATAGATGLTATLGATGATIVGGALAGAAGSIASQAFGVATGIQDSFSWKGVALAAIAGGVGGALGASNVFGKISSSPFVQGAMRGAAGNALTQGLAVATGLQSKFDWAGVAVGAAVGGVVGGLSKTLGIDYGAGFDPVNMALQAGAGMAGAIAGGAARSLLTGTSFGDNVLAALPDVLGSTIGNLVADQVAKGGSTRGGRDAGNINSDLVPYSAAERSAMLPGGVRTIDPNMALAFAGEGTTGAGDGTFAKPIAGGAGGGQVGAGGASGAGAMALADGGSNPYPVNADLSRLTLRQLQAARGEFVSYAQDKGYTDYDQRLAGFDALEAAAALREAPGVALANANEVEILRAGLVPFDIAAGGYNIATGNGGLRDYTAVGGVVAGPILGKVAGAASPLIGRLGRTVGTPITRGIAFENIGVKAAQVEAFLPGQSVRRLSVRAFDDAGNLLPGRTVLDLAGNRIDDVGLGALEFKLHEGVSLTARQAQHLPYLARNGGQIVGNNGRSIGLFAGDRIDPLAVQRINGPTLPLTWWP
jgi:hypothetical protein